jgi:hypothetical protein
MFFNSFSFGQYDSNELSPEEELMRAKTKQINQFFRRFNNEETEKGDRLYPGNSKYHEPNTRKKYLNNLFDLQATNISAELKEKFVSQLIAKNTQKFLDFHGGDWYAEVACDFLYRGSSVKLLLFMKLEKENDGSKWVLANVYFEEFKFLFSTPAPNPKPFLHPMSHELDFMNLHKIFKDSNIIEYFGANDYSPDYLTLFFYEVKKSNLKFETVTGVKFHFLQIDNWYFEVTEFNRNNSNSGWLISNLLQVGKEDKKQFINLISHE